MQPQLSTILHLHLLHSLHHPHLNLVRFPVVAEEETNAKLQSLGIASGQSWSAVLRSALVRHRPCEPLQSANGILEVGQALLQRYENYVRKYHALEEHNADLARALVETKERAELLQQTNDGLLARNDELTREFSNSEKRLGHALVSHDVSDSSNKALLQELDAARSVIERLSAQNARTAGWDVKLAATVQEMDDLRAELDSERMRNRAAEAKAYAAGERCNKLEADLHYASEQLEHMRLTRSEFSDEILNDARTRLRSLQTSASHSSFPSADVIQTLETLVADNELLKKDTAELQNLLAESREDNRVLRDDLEEARISGHRDTAVNTPTSATWYHPSNGRVTPSFRSHRQTESLSVNGARSPILRAGFRLGSPRLHIGDDLHMSTSSANDETASTSSRASHGRHVSHITVEIDPAGEVGEERPRGNKPLMLLARSRGVQTDDVPITVTVPSGGTSPRPSVRSSNGKSINTPVDTHSESSSILDSAGSHKPAGSVGSVGSGTLGGLVVQVATLLQRLREADVPTLSARLKRQQLFAGGSGEQPAGAAGALAGIAAGLGIGPAADRDRQTRDVLAHLSRTTVDRVIREAGHLDALPPPGQDETSATRRELRALQTLLKEIFAETGRLRTEVNHIVLNPAAASKFSEDIMSAEKTAAADDARKRTKSSSSQTAGGGGWIGPISKLFGGSSPIPPAQRPAVVEPGRPRSLAPRMSKVSATVGASIATAHVGFTKSGTRGVNAIGESAWDALPPVASSSTSMLASPSHTSSTGAGPSTRPPPDAASSSRVLALFAHAPTPRPERDWVVLPRDMRDIPHARDVGATATLRSRDRKRLSRNLDALHFDGPGGPAGPETGEVQVTRTLRGRGLSDSSIRSTFLADVDRIPGDSHEPSAVPAAFSGAFAAAGMFGALSKRVQNFGYYHPQQQPLSSSPPPASPIKGPRTQSPASSNRSAGPAPVAPIPISASARLLQGLADNAPMRSSSLRDEGTLERAMSRNMNV